MTLGNAYVPTPLVLHRVHHCCPPRNKQLTANEQVRGEVVTAEAGRLGVTK